ncbi:dihydrofolate reductase [Sphingobacterium sp. E70]|uniref:dihydrofolate reductase n=1 Tax=Sphingobacterium sp. E70 TaxID=2853439 RepID=UPI00211C0EB2|nr:dihydrofolate reductase [Sphingobacterium sp. E70]
MSNPTITLIVAASENNAIGINNQMPWHLPNDFKYFKRNTIEHSVLMGRKTFDAIGKALPDRRNIVITRNANFQERILMLPTVSRRLFYIAVTSVKYLSSVEQISINRLYHWQTRYF